MKKVRYVCKSWWNEPTHIGLTPDKIYNVIRYIPGPNNYLDRVEILNDNGVLDDFLIHSYTEVVEFEDVTIEIRNDIIDDILN